MDYLLNARYKSLEDAFKDLKVLNLIINGLPSKLKKKFGFGGSNDISKVLNLIINGLPSKHN